MPVLANLSDLISRVEWVFSHPDEANAIAARALLYARTYLSMPFARRHAAAQLLKAVATRPAQPRSQMTEFHPLGAGFGPFDNI